MAKRKLANICINIVSSLSHIELLQYDMSKGAFVHVDSDEFMFDPASREMLDEEEVFKTVIKRLYERNKIPLRTPTTLVVPSFFTRQYTIPEGLGDEDLETVLISEAERFYVFKKIDPEVGYCIIKDDQVLYTAYPKQPLDVMRNSFVDLKIPLLSIDCNYTATIRGLVAMGVVQTEVSEMIKWGLMIVSDFNVFMAVISGSLIEKTLEAPLSLQNAEESSLLGEIRDDFQQFYGFEVLSRLVIINNSLKLFSTTIVDTMQFQGPTTVYDQNDHTLASRGAQEAPFPCTLEAIGGALVNVMPAIPALELCDPEVLKAKVDEDRKNLIALAMLGVAGLIFGLQYGVTIILDSMIQSEQQKGQQINMEIKEALDSLEIVPEVKRKLYVKQGTFHNYRFNDLLIKLADVLPDNAWLSEATINSTSDLKTLEVNLLGGIVNNADTLNTYMNELNQVLGSKPIVLNVVPKQKENERYFEYTLTNIDKGGPKR